MPKIKKRYTIGFVVLGLACLLGLIFEYVVIMFEQFVYNKLYRQFTITESITHWLIISGLWGILGLVLFYVAARVYGYNFSKKKHFPSQQGWIVSGLLVLSSFGLKFRIYSGWKIAIDFKQSGWFQFIFQSVYCLFQAIIIIMTVIYMQEAAERLLRHYKIKSRHLPSGGIILAATWGAAHLITETKLLIAVCYIILCLLIGAAHLAANKNFYISYILTVLILLV